MIAGTVIALAPVSTGAAAQAEAAFAWRANDLLDLSASASLFIAGDFIGETRPADTILMLGLEAGVRF